jgi:hypothetical protein
MSYFLSYRKSKVPVWSDTLLPEFPDLASAIKRAHQMNHQTSSPKRKRQCVERHSRESSLKFKSDIHMDLNGSKWPRHSIEKDGAEFETVESPTILLRNSSSPTPMSSFDRPSTTVVPFLNTSEMISFDAESCHTSVIQQQKTSLMDVDTPIPTQPPKPERRMLFKPVLHTRRNQPTTYSAQDFTPLPSDSAHALSTSLSVAQGHSKTHETEVISRPPDDAPLENTTSPRSRLPLPSPRRHGPAQIHSLPIPQSLRTDNQKTSTLGVLKSCMPTPPSLQPPRRRDAKVAEEVDIQNTRVSLSKEEDYGNATDTDAELIVDLLLCGTPEESHNPLPTPLQEEIMEDSQLQSDYEDEEDKESADEDTAAIEGLATRFLQGSVSPFEDNSVVF